MHKVVAVASRDVKKADDFVKDHVSTVQKDDSDPKATAYGSYDELYADEVSTCPRSSTTVVSNQQTL